MKKTIYLVVFLNFAAFSQNKYLTKTGSVTFQASVPAFEEVKATSSSTTAILDTSNGAIAALSLVKGFRFKNALMEEHFNENYADSDTYPKTNFRGNIINFDINKLTSVKTEMRLNGSLTFRGEIRELKNVLVELSRNNDIINVSGTFKVTPSEFNIKIPKIVRDKITEFIEVYFNFKLQKK